jgi:hypothetical protein
MKRKLKYTRTFLLIRNIDETGVSGTGIVAHGVILKSGRVVMEWLRPPCSIGMFGSMQEMIQIHGHGGKTKVRFIGEA